MKIVLEAILRLSGQVIKAVREILVLSYSLSPNHDPIRSFTQIWLSTAKSGMDHALEKHCVKLNHLTEITRVTLLLINLGMNV